MRCSIFSPALVNLQTHTRGGHDAMKTKEPQADWKILFFEQHSRIDLVYIYSYVIKKAKGKQTISERRYDLTLFRKTGWMTDE